MRRPEHLAAMKIQAMKNGPRRTPGEIADIRFILTLPGIDEPKIRGYFERAGLRDDPEIAALTIDDLRESRLVVCDPAPGTASPFDLVDLDAQREAHAAR